LRSCNPFWNAIVMNEGGVSQFRKFGYKIGCHGKINKIPRAIAKSLNATWLKTFSFMRLRFLIQTRQISYKFAFLCVKRSQ